MTDPIRNIEDEKAQKDMGVMGWRVYEGAVEDGASHWEAVWITIAFYTGMFKGSVEGGE